MSNVMLKYADRSGDDLALVLSPLETTTFRLLYYISPASSHIMVRPQWQGSPIMALVYLTSWIFVVSINSSVSDQFPRHQGVLQGSNLGTFLFILYATPFSVLLSLTHHVLIIFMLMTLNYSFPPLLLIYLSTSCAYKRQLTLFSTGCLQISFHSIELILSFSILVYLNSSLKSLIPLYSCLLM